MKTSLLVAVIALTWLMVAESNTSVEKLHIRSDISSRFATTQILSDVRNTLSSDQEVVFNVVIPKEAFITNFSMTIDNEVFSGLIKGKSQAKKQYQTAKKRGQSAGLVEQEGRDSNKFKISVNVAGNTTVEFNLSYQELLRRKLGLYNHVIHMEPGQIVPDMKVDIFITESKKISVLEPPILQAQDNTKHNISQITINWPSESEVHIRYNPTAGDQGAVSPMGLSGVRLLMRYDVERSLSAGEVMAVDGYFVHFIAPKGLKPIPKRIVFVLDSSSSMTGRKMEQMRTAMLTILKDLRPIDKFNVIDFDYNIQPWKKQMMPVSKQTLRGASKFVKQMKAGGSTNIANAMEKGLSLLWKDNSEGIPMIIFLTDGQPSTGITNHELLEKSITGWNTRGARIMSLAFGQGASYSLLQQISGRNQGVARKIYEDADAELQLEGFYDEVSTPILSEVKIKYLGESVDNSTVTTTDFSTLFEGSEIIVSGKLSEKASPTFDLSLAANVAEGNIVLDETFETSMPVGKTSTGAELSRFTERLWAFLTIKQLLEEQSFVTPERSEAIREKVTQLSLKYGFVTPYTSLVVTKPQKPEKLPEPNKDSPDAGKPSPWKPSAGYADNDPHFVIALKGLDLPICFDVMGQDGDVLKLVSDPVTGLEVDGKVFSPHHRDQRTFFGAIIMKTTQFTVKVTPRSLMVDHMKLKWRENMMIRWQGKAIGFMGKNNLTIHIAKDIDFVIMKHNRIVKGVGRVKFLGFYMNNAQGLSNKTSGLLGEFRHKMVVSTDFRPPKNAMVHAYIGLLNLLSSDIDVVKARLRHRPDLEHDTVLACWAVDDIVLSRVSGSYRVNRQKPKTHSQE